MPQEGQAPTSHSQGTVLVSSKRGTAHAEAGTRHKTTHMHVCSSLGTACRQYVLQDSCCQQLEAAASWLPVKKTQQTLLVMGIHDLRHLCKDTGTPHTPQSMQRTATEQTQPKWAGRQSP